MSFSSVRPVSVSLVSSVSQLVEGTTYDLVCRSWGSRPPATITWYRGGTEHLADAVLTVKNKTSYINLVRNNTSKQTSLIIKL